MLRSRFVSFFLLVIMVTASQSQEVNGFRIINVTFDTYKPTQLAINRGRLIWADTDVNTNTLNLKYFSGAEIVKLDSNLVGVSAAIDGDYVVWNTSSQQVKAYHVRAWTTSTLGASYYNPALAQQVSVSNGTVAHVARNSGTGSAIVLYDLNSGVDTSFSAGTWNVEPSIHHGQLAWVASDSETTSAPSNVFFYDGLRMRNISESTGGRNRSPILKDAQVAWLQSTLTTSRVMVFTGDSVLTLAEPSNISTIIVGYDLSNGIAVAGMADTVSGNSAIKIFNSETGTITTLNDPDKASSLHIDNGWVTWASGTGFQKVLKICTLPDGNTQSLGATDNPVVDDEQVAWTFGDAVEMRVPVTYQQMTTDLQNGWAQTRFKEIDDGRIIWGNFDKLQFARLFYSDGRSTIQLTDSLVYKDFIMSNDGYAIWREDFTSLWLYNGSGVPVRVVDSLQCENMYVAGGSIGFHGFRVNSGSTVNQAWLYRIDSGSLTQLTHDTSQTVMNGITLVDGNTACWYRDNSVENMLMYYDGATTMRLSDSTIDSKFSYQNGIIVWSEMRNGVMQIMMYNTASGTKTQITQGILDALSPITDGSKIVWFEGTGSNSGMCYFDIASGATTRVAHYQPPIFRWLWLSSGKIAWSGNNEVLVFDGNVISQLTNSGSFRPNTEPYVDNEILLWKQDSPIPSFPTYGDIFKGKLHAHVAFEAMNISGVAPLSVSFYNRSWQGVQTHNWDFGDGETSPEKHPVHTYQKPGTYTITLTVTGLNGVVEERKIHLIRVITPTSVSGASSEIPKSFALHQNYPNPFNPTTTIRFDVPRPSPITIKIYDILGREVTTLIDRKFEAGVHAAIWDGKNSRELPVTSGVYFIRMRAGEFVWVRKLALMR